jgi:hypothetical protein
LRSGSFLFVIAAYAGIDPTKSSPLLRAREKAGACRLVFDVVSFAGMDKELKHPIIDEAKSHFFEGGVE